MKKTRLVTAAALMAIALTACGDKNAASTAAAPETEMTETESPTEEEVEKLAMGTTTTIGNWDITVNSMQILDTIPDGYGQYDPEDGNKYMLVSITATNNGKESDIFLPTLATNNDIWAKVFYSDGYEFSQTNLLGYSRSMVQQSINPLSSKEGDIAFELPMTVTDSTEQLLLEFSSGNQKVDFILR